MSEQNEESNNWQRRLLTAFRGPRGSVGDRALELDDAERRHSASIMSTVPGLNLLLNSYQDFAVGTIEAAKSHGAVLNVYVLGLNVAGLNRLRAALRLWYSGYYFEAGSLARAVWEFVLYLASVYHGRLRYSAILDIPGIAGSLGGEARALRKRKHDWQTKMAKEVRRFMITENSALDDRLKEHVDEMVWFLHSHVHHGESELIWTILDTMVRNEFPHVGPQLDLKKGLGSVWQLVALSWMHTRVLPYVTAPSRFDAEWTQRRAILDGAYRDYFQAWDSPMRPAIVKLVDSRFEFEESEVSPRLAVSPGVQP